MDPTVVLTFEFLDYKDLCTAACVSKSWKKGSENNALWKRELMRCCGILEFQPTDPLRDVCQLEQIGWKTCLQSFFMLDKYSKNILQMTGRPSAELKEKISRMAIGPLAPQLLLKTHSIVSRWHVSCTNHAQVFYSCFDNKLKPKIDLPGLFQKYDQIHRQSVSMKTTVSNWTENSLFPRNDVWYKQEKVIAAPAELVPIARSIRIVNFHHARVDKCEESRCTFFIGQESDQPPTHLVNFRGYYTEMEGWDVCLEIIDYALCKVVVKVSTDNPTDLEVCNLGPVLRTLGLPSTCEKPLKHLLFVVPTLSTAYQPRQYF